MRSLYAQFNSHNNAIMAPVGTIRTVFAISKSVRHMLSQIYSCCHCYLLRRRPATCISTHTYIHTCNGGVPGMPLPASAPTNSYLRRDHCSRHESLNEFSPSNLCCLCGCFNPIICWRWHTVT